MKNTKISLLMLITLSLVVLTTGNINQIGNTFISQFYHGDGSNITGIKQAYSYVIYQDATGVHAKNGRTGVVDFSDSTDLTDTIGDVAAVINSAITTGGATLIQISPGVYFAAQTIVLQNGVNLIGAGVDTSGSKGVVIYKHFNGGYVITFNTAMSNNYVRVEGLQIRGQGGFSGGGIKIESSRWAKIYNNYVGYLAGDAIAIANTGTHPDPTSNYIENNVLEGNNGNGIVVGGSDQQILKNIIDLASSTPGSGVYAIKVLQNMWNNNIVGNHIYTGGYSLSNSLNCVLISAGDTNTMVNDNYIDNCNIGILNYGDTGTFTGNLIFLTAQSGLDMEGGIRNTITGNTFYGTSSSATYYPDIYLNGVDTHNNTITGNVFNYHANGGNHPDYAVKEGPTTTFNLVMSNTIGGGYPGTIYLYPGSGSEKHFNLGDNITG